MLPGQANMVFPKFSGFFCLTPLHISVQYPHIFLTRINWKILVIEPIFLVKILVSLFIMFDECVQWEHLRSGALSYCPSLLN